MAQTRKLSEIAREIKATWSLIGNGVSPCAKPYLDAMMELESVDQAYYAEDGRTQVRYFIANAASFRGADARRLKAELKALL